MCAVIHDMILGALETVFHLQDERAGNQCLIVANFQELKELLHKVEGILWFYQHLRLILFRNVPKVINLLTRV